MNRTNRVLNVTSPFLKTEESKCPIERKKTSEEKIKNSISSQSPNSIENCSKSTNKINGMIKTSPVKMVLANILAARNRSLLTGMVKINCIEPFSNMCAFNEEMIMQ
jgi:hypothetical protein